MTSIEHAARVLKILVPALVMVGVAAWWFPTAFERLFGYGPLILAQFFGLPALWLLSVAANVLIMAVIIGLMFGAGWLLNRLSRSK